MKYRLKVTSNDGSGRELTLHGNSMNQLVEKLIEWQTWENNVGAFINFKESPEYITEEFNSGFYYIKG
jgi:hypothetical protein